MAAAGVPTVPGSPGPVDSVDDAVERLKRETNRVQIVAGMLTSDVDLVERGDIDAEDLDTCVSWGIGYKLAVVGPMALLDMAGLDIYNAVGSKRELLSRVLDFAAAGIARVDPLLQIEQAVERAAQGFDAWRELEVAAEVELRIGIQ